MTKKILNARQALLKGYLKDPITQDEARNFKDNLKYFFANINTSESEEFNKNLIIKFLNNAYYAKQGYMVNTYHDTDLAIYEKNVEGREKPVVLFEFKGPEKPDMITKESFQSKAMYQLIYYYLQEEIANENHNITFLIITDCKQFFLFEKKTFYNLFAKDKQLVKDIRKAIATNSDTQYIYNKIIAPVVAKVEDKMTCTYMRLWDLKKEAENENATVSQKLIAYYKLLSPVHLLCLPFKSDHNRLDRKFYKELLYIMGLEEVTENKQKIIKRLKEGQRQHYSLMEQTYSLLEDYKSIGDEKQRFDVALGLVVIWVNRLLFLKLLESQLVAFNKSADYKFLDIVTIPDYHILSDLFRKVLAKPYNEREEYLRDYFANVPYLNSSLFEFTELEQKYFPISNLRLSEVVPYRKTVVTDGSGNKITRHINELEYIFRFFDAFDFGDTVNENTEVSDNSRTIIDASVLGLIFEKINGYKDGSIFSPGYITQYMCEKTIRQAVVDKFNENYEDWHCESFESLKDHINTFDRNARTEANDIINSLKICDIAVGSGHFLVSALNEIIAIKGELGVLQDHSTAPKPINSYQVSVESDELVLKDEDGDAFFYNPKDHESQRVQETLFEEKKTIIENCLFGVDLNPKSVEICRLRLWIELLKSAYYHNSEDGRVLRTLPNIDINIRCGDSLASRQPVRIGQGIEGSGDNTQTYIADYKLLVKEYINSPSKKIKRDIKSKISDIKKMLNPPVQQDFFFINKPLTARQTKEKKVFSHAFEWTIEFPDILDDKGKLRGFDIIIGNPPYINLQGLKDEAFVYSHMKQTDENNHEGPTYQTITPRADMYPLFIERALQLLRKDGYLSFIIPNKWQKVMYGKPLRKLFLKEDLTDMTDFGDNQVFGDATTYTCIINVRKRPSQKKTRVANIHELHEKTLVSDIDEQAEIFDLSDFTDGIWFTSSLANHKKLMEILGHGDDLVTLDEYIGGKKHSSEKKRIGEGKNNVEESYRGILTGLSEAFLISQSVYESLMEDPSSSQVLRPYLSGNGLVAFKEPDVSEYIVLIPKGFTRQGMEIGEDEELPSEDEAWQWFSNNYPSVANWLLPFKAKAKRRTDKGDYWWELRACDYYDKFAEPKIMYQVFQTKPCFIYEPSDILCNNSVYFISSDDLSLLSFLNSSMGWFLISEYCPRIQNGYQLIWDNFSQIPIPKELPATLTTLAEEASEAVANTTKGDNRQYTDVRQRIDNEVEQLYL